MSDSEQVNKPIEQGTQAAWENQFRHLYERSADAIVILAANRFIDANDAAVKMFQYQRREDFQSLHPAQISPEFQPDGSPSMEKADRMIEIAMQQGGHRFEWDHMRAGGQVFPAEVSLTPVPFGDEIRVYAIMRDISERKRLARQVEQAHERRGAQVALNIRIAQLFASFSDLDTLFNQVVALVQENLGYYHTQLLRYDPDQNILSLVSSYGEMGQKLLAAGHHLPMGSGLVGAAVATGQTVLRQSVQDDPEWQLNPLLPDTCGEIAIPIKFAEQVLGVLDVHSSRERQLTEEDQVLLEGLCSQLAIAIHDRLLLEQSAQALQEAELARQNLAQEQALLRTLIDALPDSIYFKDTEARFLLNNAAHIRSFGFENQEDLLGKTDLDVHPVADAPKYYNDDLMVIRTGQPLINREEQAYIATYGEQRWYNTTKVPLHDQQGNIVGLVGISSDITDRKHSSELLAHRAADLAKVAQISTAIAAELDLEKLLQSVVDLTQANFDLYHAHVYLLDEAEGELVLAAGSGEVGREMIAQDWRIDLETGGSLVAQAARLRKGVMVNDVQNEIGFLPNPLLPDTRAELAVPMIAGTQLLGVLDVQASQVDRFAEEDLGIQTTLASQVAVALQNARRNLEREHLLKNIENLVGERTLELTSSQQMLQTVLDHFPGVVFWKDRSSLYLGCNEAFAHGAGLESPVQIVGKTDFDLPWAQTEAPAYVADDQKVMESATPRLGIIETQLQADGSIIWLDTSKVPLLDSNGRVVGVMGTSTDITDRMRAEQEVRESQQRLSLLAANLPDMVFILDKDGLIRLSEGRGLLEVGWQPGQLVGQLAYNVYQDVPQIREDIQYCLASGEELVTSVEINALKFETRYVPLLDEQAQVNGALVVATNITERMKLEAEQKRLVSIVESSPDIIGVSSLDGRVQYMNPAGLALLGYPPSALRGEGFTISSLQPDLPEEVLQTAMASGVWAGESVMVHKDGHKIPVSQVVTVTKDSQGNPLDITTIARDITESKKAETAILYEKNFADSILNTLPGVFYMFDVTGKLLRWNDNYLNVVGYTAEEAAHKNAMDAIAPENWDRVTTAIQNVFVQGEGSVEALLLNTKGVRLPYFFTGVRLVVGEALYVLGVGIDLSDRKQAEEAVRASQRRLSLMIQQLPLGVIEWNTNFEVVDWNPAAEQIYGYSRNEARGRHGLGLILPEEDRTTMDGIWARLTSGTDSGGTYENQTKDGRKIICQWYNTLLTDSSGELIGVTSLIADVTEQKRLEQQVHNTLERRGYQVQVGTQLAQEIAASPDLYTIFERVVTLVKEQFGYYHTQILRYEPGMDAISLAAAYGQVGQQMLAAGHRIPMGEGLIGTAAATGQTLLRASLQDDPEWHANPLLPDTQGEIAVPIKLRDQVLGVLDVQSDRPAALDEDDRLLLEGLCGQIAVAIEDTRLRQEMEDRLNELNMLYRATSREGWENFQRQSRLSSGYLYERTTLRPVDELNVLGTQGSPSEPASPPVEVTATPLLIYGEVIGALGVVEDPNYPLTLDEKVLIEQVSDQVAQALESARLFEQTQTVLAQTQSLYTGSAQIVSSDTLDDVLQALVRSTQLGRLDQVIIELFDQPWTDVQPDVMINAAVWEHHGDTSREPVGTSYNLSEYPIYRHLRRSEPLIVYDVFADERVDEHTRQLAREQLSLRGLAFWPLVAGGEWFGLLSGQSHTSLDLVSEDIQAINTLIGQASIVIQGIRLQDDMRERVSELTNLQRLMSRDAWMAYQSQIVDTRGYLFDRINLNPLPAEVLPSLAGNGDHPENRPLSAALQVRGEPIGMLGVRPDAGRTLSLEEEAFLEAVSEQVAQALERARLMEQTQKSAVELQAVAEVSTTTATILDPHELLQEVVDLTKSRFGLYHAHIYLMDEAGENLVLTVGAGEVGQSMAAEGWYIPIDQSDSLVAWVGRERRGKIITDVRKETGYLVNSLLPDTMSELAVPMIIAKRLLGVFDVQANTLNRFTEADIRTYSTLAAQIAVALQNAKLYAEQLATVERLRELDNMKSAFLANMSHELRTPLNSILGFTQVILEELDGPLTDLMVSDLELIEKNGKHLLNLINDVLDMAKIEAGRLTLSLEPINLYDMLDEVILTNAALARDKSLYMNLDADPAGDWVVMADHVRIRQILINLIGNSIKFTELGGITINLEKIWSMEDNIPDQVRVHIHDTGIGIPQTKLEDIFEAFSQVDSSTTRKAGGTGLGLPISRRLVELHGGKLWAESEGSGHGSTLMLELPVNRIE